MDDAVRARLARLFAEADHVVLLGGESLAGVLSVPTAPLAEGDEAPAGTAAGAIVDVADEDDLRAAVARAAAATRAGGTVAVVSTAGHGGVRGAMRRLLRRPPPVELERLCEALLLAHLEDVRAQPGDDAPPLAWARVPEDR